MKKKILAIVLAALLSCGLCLSGCDVGGGDSGGSGGGGGDDGGVSLRKASNGYYIPSAPEEPVFLSDYRRYGDTFRMEGYLFSTEPLDATEMQVKIVDSFFYYSVSITEMSRWDMSTTIIYQERESTKQKDMLEVFMEYNNADWSELYELYYNDEKAYEEKMEEWKSRYEEIKDEIPTFYYCYISVSEIKEEKYEEALQDPNLTEGTSYYPPEREEKGTVSEMDITFGDKTIRYTFGKYTYTNFFWESYGKYGDYFGYGTILDKWCFGITQDPTVTIYFTPDSQNEFTLSLSACVLQNEKTEERETANVTLKSYEFFSDPLPGMEIEEVKVKYVNMLGVAIEQEWDLNTDFTMTARNVIEGDKDYFRFWLDVTWKCEEEINIADNWWFFSVLSVEIDGVEGFGYMNNQVCRKINNLLEYYARTYDGVDIYQREKNFDDTAYVNPGDIASEWNYHGYYDEVVLESFWERYVRTGSIL